MTQSALKRDTTADHFTDAGVAHALAVAAGFMHRDPVPVDARPPPPAFVRRECLLFCGNPECKAAYFDRLLEIVPRGEQRDHIKGALRVARRLCFVNGMHRGTRSRAVTMKIFQDLNLGELPGAAP